jgi:hypothetical protein
MNGWLIFLLGFLLGLGGALGGLAMWLIDKKGREAKIVLPGGYDAEEEAEVRRQLDSVSDAELLERLERARRAGGSAPGADP